MSIIKVALIRFSSVFALVSKISRRSVVTHFPRRPPLTSEVIQGRGSSYFSSVGGTCSGGLLKRGASSTKSNTKSDLGSPVHDLSSKWRVTRSPKILRGFLSTMKFESERFKSLLTPELLTLHQIFTKYGYEIRMAGGAVRDLLMEKTPADIDFATPATPQEMKDMFTAENIRMINMKGETHGTITARINDKENFEVTTLRIDVTTDGRHAEVEFTKDWELDAGRRDLTVNSMFLGFDGTLYDYFNGVEDLKARRIKFVGCPEDRIKEDYLRILRYFRFYGRLARDEESDIHDQSTLDVIRDNMPGLSGISGERIWVELRKILQGNYFDKMILLMINLGIGPFIGLPKKLNLESFKSLVGRAKDLDLTLNPMTLLASLLADPEEVLQLNKRLKLSAFERDLCLFVVLHRGDKEDGIPFRPYQKLLAFSKSKPQDVRIWIEETLKYNGAIALLKEFQEWDLPKFPVNGHMLREAQVPVGKSMTLIMNELKDIWVNRGFEASAEELMAHLPTIAQDLGIKLKSPERKT